MSKTKLFALGAVLALAACGNIAGPDAQLAVGTRGINAESSSDSVNGGGGNGGGAAVSGGTLGSGYDIYAPSNGTLGSGY